ncbi:MAG: hypothetical protein LBI45_01940 [Bacteroidales bacterium]|jgi:hypothetical protein|nr:hypothetical protein [Bacteroidales bacterium]
MKKLSSYKWLFLLISICFASCFSKKQTFPLETVANIVADCYFLEAELSVMKYKYDTNEIAKAKYDSIFNLYGINRDIYLQNVIFYFSNSKFSEIFRNRIDEIVEERSTALKDSLNNSL